MPSTIEQIQRSMKDRTLTVLAINIQEPTAAVTKWVRDRQLTSTVLLDRDGRVSSAYKVTATPTVFIVGKDGKLVAKGAGTRPWTSPEGRALLTALTR